MLAFRDNNETNGIEMFKFAYFCDGLLLEDFDEISRDFHDYLYQADDETIKIIANTGYNVLEGQND